MSTIEMPATTRTELLSTEVAKYSARGWTVESVIGATATLAKTRRFSAVCHGFLTVITLGLWTPILVVAKLRARTRRVLVSVDPAGNVTTRAL